MLGSQLGVEFYPGPYHRSSTRDQLYYPLRTPQTAEQGEGEGEGEEEQGLHSVYNGLSFIKKRG